MRRLLVATVIAAFAAPAAAQPKHEFLCRGWRVTGYLSNGCPAGLQQTDSCGCAPTQPEVAPKWYGGQVAFQIENQGGGGLSGSQFITAARNAAQAWNNVSCSSLVIDASATLAAGNSARWGSNNNNSNEHGVFMVTSNNEWMTVTGAGAGGSLGVSVSPYSGWGCSGREFFDTDILINGFVVNGWTQSSVQSIIMHEMGHAIGLGHPCLSTPFSWVTCSNECNEVMAATSGIDYQLPQQGDTNGVCLLYPGTPGGLGSSCLSNDICTSGPCITYQNFTYCSQTCTTSCPDGYKCQLVDSQNVCVRKGAPEAGEPCTGACASGAICMGDGSGQGGTCHAECNPTAPNCTGQDRCVELEGGGGVCWPPGTQQLGEECASASSGDCAPGLVCIGDQGTEPNVIAHCFTECNGLQCNSCGSAFQCLDLDDATHTGICLAAAAENADCVATEYVCGCGFECTPESSTIAFCKRSCDWNDPASCGTGLTCVTLVDQNQNPVAGACFPEGDNVEGEGCVSGNDCEVGLLCVSTGVGGGECLALCNPVLDGSDCPHSGQDCIGLTGSTEGVCSPAGGSAGPGPGPGPGPTGTKGYLDHCTSDAECASSICRVVSAGREVCLRACDPQLGHLDCSTLENSGCKPNDPTDLPAGGLCRPNEFDPAGLGVGEACSYYRECFNGLCDGGMCLVPCTDEACEGAYACDQSTTTIGICRPSGVCGCPQTGNAGVVPSVAVIFFFAWSLQRRRRWRIH
ncbi:MAG: hypothetical protein V3T05_06475 [Myxococcota bacterium]